MKILKELIPDSANRYCFSWAYGNEKENLRRMQSNNLQEIKDAILSVADGYSIARGFAAQPKLLEEKEDCKRRVYQEMAEKIKSFKKPSGPNQAISQVNDFCGDLKGWYERKLVSASSKLLWFKFCHPIVIYDNLACEALENLSGKKIKGNYRDFYRESERQYVNIERDIKDYLKIKTKSYRDIYGDGFDSVFKEEWFLRRIFDACLVAHGRNEQGGKAS